MKRVRFNEDSSRIAEYHPIQHWKDISKKQASQIWFTKKDYDRMKKNDDIVLNFMENGTASNAKVCTRGLEKKTQCALSYKQCVRLDAMCAVLAEQERQRVQHTNDPYRIAMLYSEATAESIKDALYWGIEDAQAALLIGDDSSDDETDGECKSTSQYRRIGSIHQPTPNRKRSRALRMQRMLGLGERSPLVGVGRPNLAA